MNSNFRAYLAWYLGATRTKLKGQWTQTDYDDIESSDDEDTSYDHATRAGTMVDAAPILDRVGNAVKQSVMDIERFPRTGVDESALNNFLGLTTSTSASPCCRSLWLQDYACGGRVGAITTTF